jgi:hypothetical protein
MRIRALHWVTVASLLFVCSLAVPRVKADDDDPPGRVARLSYTHGQVSFNPAGTDDWVGAVVNRPMTTGDKLWTDQDGRAELHIGSAAIRLSGTTGFSFLNLSDRMMQIRLTEGTANLRVRRLEEDEAIEIDTPNIAFSVLRPGLYRVSVNEEGDTTMVTVRDGQGEATGGGSAFTVHPGELGVFIGTDSLSANVEGMPDDDDFDRWCDQRDLREDHAVSRRYVSEDVIGYEDLDDNGGWRAVPEYGEVWFPHTTVVGWAPYRYGHWAYIAPWGWTWVDDAPWGFAPFHYGRWVTVGGAWGWIPCRPPVVAVAYVRPVYAPALVAWVGGPHFAVGVGVGGGFAAGVNVGWFPLGPREVFVPSYPVSRRYVNNVNISNTTVNQTVVNNYYNTTVVNKNVTVNNVRYVNQSVPGAVTATSGQNFSSAQPVGRNLVAVNSREIASAPVAVAAPAVAPPKQAVLGSGAVTNFHPPAALATRPVVAKSTPPPPPPAFARQQAAIQANQGRPITMTQAHQLQPEPAHNNIAPVRMAPTATRVTPIPPNGNRNVQAVQPNNNRPQTNVGTNNNQPQNQTNVGGQNNNRPQTNAGTTNNQLQNQTNVGGQNNNRPQNQTNVGGVQNNNTNTNQMNRPPNAHNTNDRPPAARTTTVNPQLEEKHQNQIQQLQQKQDSEYQKLQQKQNQEQQRLAQQKADEMRQQQAQQKQQQQLQQMEQKHEQQRQVLNDKQQVEHAKTAPPPQSKPKPEEKEKPHR